ncbi:MAG: OadG family protein [Clostridia bacterium]|nr:OadG family protein [Clostridia bacterium]
MMANFRSGFQIMGIGMAAVFGVLAILYIVIKLLGLLARVEIKKDE